MCNNLKNNPIKIACIGDIMVGGEYITRLEKKNLPLISPFTEFFKCFCHDADIFIANLEGPFKRANIKSLRPSVSCHLWNHDILLDWLPENLKCIFNLANNHMMDFGKEGLENTIELLNKKGISYVGAGLTEDEAYTPKVIEYNGKKIGLLAFTSDEPHIGAVIAKGKSAGCASYQDNERVISTIKSLKKRVDIVCTNMHWGYEFFYYPQPEIRELAHKMADAGADIIIGHHPHVVQGIEHYHESLIAYSLGNFFLPPVRLTNNRISPRKKYCNEWFSFKIKLDNLEYGVEIISGIILKNYVIRSNTKRQDQFQLINRFCKPLSDGNYNSFWLEYRKKRERELKSEAFFDMFNKLFVNCNIKTIRNINIADIKRNMDRIKNIPFG